MLRTVIAPETAKSIQHISHSKVMGKFIVMYAPENVMDQRERGIRTQPARCEQCGNIFIAGITEEKGAYMMGSEHCTCGCEEFDLINIDGTES